MCDETDLAHFDRVQTRGIDRRQFARLGAATTLGAFAASVVQAQDGTLSERSVAVPTPDGTMDGFFVHPAQGTHPAVIIWPDIAGLRDAKRNMARRLAAAGFAVLVVNPYYRSVPAAQFTDFADFRDQGGFQKVGPWRAELNPDAIMRDTVAFVAWLDGQDAVDKARGIGNQGYCMGGPFTVWAAAASPRIAAAASFHGGGLVVEGDTSPHRLFGQTQARFLIAIAQNDDERAPDEKDVLRAAAEQSGHPAEIEVYAGDHGWTVPDSPVYAEAEAERAWQRLQATYQAAL